MSKFNYIASNPSGETTRGILEASDKSDVAKKLKSKGLFLVTCRSEESENGVPAGLSAGRQALPPAAERFRLTGTAPSPAAAPPASGDGMLDRLDSFFHPNKKKD